MTMPIYYLQKKEKQTNKIIVETQTVKQHEWGGVGVHNFLPVGTPVGPKGAAVTAKVRELRNNFGRQMWSRTDYESFLWEYFVAEMLRMDDRSTEIDPSSNVTDDESDITGIKHSNDKF